MTTHRDSVGEAVNDWFTIEPIDSTTIAISEYDHFEEMHSYLLIGQQRSLLIDSGLGIANIKPIVEQFVDSQTVQVVSTHAHWDHVGGHHAFAQRFIHRNEADWLTKQFPLPAAVVRKNFTDDCFAHGKPEWFDAKHYTVFQCDTINVIDDGYCFDLGDRQIECLLTPGHSPGHLCFLDRERGLLFSGDAIYYGTIYLNYPSTDPAAYDRSIQRLAARRSAFQRILPAHHALAIDSNILDEVQELLAVLRREGRIQHGAGITSGARIALSM